jgi:prepilin-type N-terminal cleavage/methylation domain-containing protein
MHLDSRGYTFIEVVLVVAIMGLMALVSSPFLSTTLTSSALTTNADLVSDTLRQAQSSAMSRKNTGKFGLHFEATKFVLFEGATYNASDVNNDVHTLTGEVGFSAVALTPGGSCTVASGSGNCDVHFVNHRGVPTESGTITLLNVDGASKTITINAVGMIDVN